MKIILLLFVLPLKSLYLVCNKRPSKYYWKLPIDDKIPLIPIFIIPYLLHHPGIVVTGAVLWNTVYIEQFLLSLIVSYIIAVAFWYFIPNGVKRPPLPEKSIFTPLIKKLYEHDGDTNGFPSAHIFVALLCGYYLSLGFPQFIFFIWTAIGMVVASVLFTKQHYIIDIVGGILVFGMSAYASNTFLSLLMQ